jgi:DNA-binding CsgD family transcriptional regulator
MDETAERLAEETTLTERQAQVVSLRVEGMGFGEIAEEMGISEGSAGNHWQRAKEKAATAKTSVEIFQNIGLLD